MIQWNIDEGYASIRVKDFWNRTENDVREEFLIPLFRAAGYEAFGPYLIVRGCNLSASAAISLHRRRYIYPDFVLQSKNFPIWIVDAKSPRTNLHKRENYRQMIAYSEALKTRNVVLSNALETCLFCCSQGSLVPLHHYELANMTESLWHELADALRPERTVREWFSFEKALDMYNTDDYVDRSFLMRILQTYEFERIAGILGDFNHNEVYKAKSFRSRALASILIAAHTQKDPALFKKITEWSLGDRDSIVRENCITTILSHWPTISESLLPSDIFSIKRHTVLEEILHWSLLRCTTQWDRIEKKCGPRDTVIRRFLELIETEAPVSFPIALVLRKPPLMSYRRYCEHLKLFAALAEKIYDHEATHFETKRVLGHCVRFARRESPKVMGIVLGHATVRQREILIEAVRLVE